MTFVRVGVWLTFSVGWLEWVGGWLEIWRVKLISTQVVVEFGVELGKNIGIVLYCVECFPLSLVDHLCVS